MDTISDESEIIISPDEYIPASMWKRLAAYLIDMFMLLTASIICAMVIGLFINGVDTWEGIAIICMFIFNIFYFASMESSVYQGTLGKMALNIYVTNYEGNVISFWRALVRTLGKYVSDSFFYLGYLMGFLTENKQMLHDFIAKTYVVEKAPYEHSVEEPIEEELEEPPAEDL